MWRIPSQQWRSQPLGAEPDFSIPSPPGRHVCHADIHSEQQRAGSATVVLCA